MPAIAMDQSTVVILNEAGVRARYLLALADAAKLYQVALVGAAINNPHSATVSPASMLYDTPESQLKKEAREEKLAVVNDRLPLGRSSGSECFRRPGARFRP